MILFLWKRLEESRDSKVGGGVEVVMHGESSTTGLLVHLKAIHKITDFDSKIENETAKREKKS